MDGYVDEMEGFLVCVEKLGNGPYLQVLWVGGILRIG